MIWRLCRPFVQGPSHPGKSIASHQFDQPCSSADAPCLTARQTGMAHCFQQASCHGCAA